MKRKVILLALAAGIVLGIFGSQILNAQQDRVKMAVLQKKDLPGLEGKEGLLFTTEIAPDTVGGKHYCTGNEFVYILQGSMILEFEGKPPVTYKQGDSFYVLPKQVHFPKNPSATTPVKVLGFAVIEKGEPMNVNVP